MSKHTPGPWARKNHTIYAVMGSNESVAQAVSIPDAKLIAASPDLLEAAKEALEACEYLQNNWESNLTTAAEFISQAADTLREAIRKAEGDA